MMKLTYDFGGAENPISGRATVVDKASEKQFRSWGYKNRYIRFNIFKKRLDVLDADLVYVARVIRYIDGASGYLAGDPINRKKYDIITENIWGNVKEGGVVEFFDHLDVLIPLLENLEMREMKITQIYLMNPPDEDFCAEWFIRMRKEVK